MKFRSVARHGGPPTGCLALAGSIGLIAVGVFLTRLLFWIPLSGWWAARSWQEVPCTVAESRVVELREKNPPRNRQPTVSWQAEIKYDYGFRGRGYRSSHVSFRDQSLYAEREDAAAVVDHHPPGLRTTCWVDPWNPADAVMYREFSPHILVGLVPMLFAGGGLFLMSWTVRQGRRAWRSR